MTLTTQHTARALRGALRRLIVTYGALDEQERPCGSPLSTPHAWALMALLERSMTVGELSTHLNIDRTNVSRLCGRMVSLGELERVQHPEDARARLVRLTERGQQVARAVEASSAEHFESVVKHLSMSPERVIDALMTLDRALSATTTFEE